MFRIGLGEHHEFDIGRIAPQPAEVVRQVIDLVVGKRQAQSGIGLYQRLAPATEQVHAGQGLRRHMVKQRLCRID